MTGQHERQNKTFKIVLLKWDKSVKKVFASQYGLLLSTMPILTSQIQVVLDTQRVQQKTCQLKAVNIENNCCTKKACSGKKEHM